MTKTKHNGGGGHAQEKPSAEPTTIKIVVPKRLCRAN